MLSALCVAACALLIGLLWLPLWRVSEVVAEGSTTLVPSALTLTAQETLRGARLYVLPRDNVLLYSRSGLISALLAAYPTLKTVDIRLRGLNTLVLAVTERTPVALWCDDAHCRLLDAQGVAYAAQEATTTSEYVIFRGELETDDATAQYLEPEVFAGVQSLAVMLASTTQSRVMSATVDEEQTVDVVFENNFRLIFSLGDEASDVVSRFLLAQTAEPFVGKELSEFEYLDLRFGDKLYYKLK